MFVKILLYLKLVIMKSLALFSLLLMLFFSCNRETTTSELLLEDTVEVSGVIGKEQRIDKKEKIAFVKEILQRAHKMDELRDHDLITFIDLDQVYCVESNIGERYLIALWRDGEGNKYSCKTIASKGAGRYMNYFCFGLRCEYGCEYHKCECQQPIGWGGCMIG